jgi:hypothetical protein
VDFREEAVPISETFPDEQLMHIAHAHSPWFYDIVNYLVTGQMPLHWGRPDKSKFMSVVKNFFWDDPYLFKYCPDQIIRRCIPEPDQSSVISFCHDHACEGHFSAKKTAAKSLYSCEGIPGRFHLIFCFNQEPLFPSFLIPLFSFYLKFENQI